MLVWQQPKDSIKSMCERMARQISFGKPEVCMCMIFLPKEDCTVIPQTPHLFSFQHPSSSCCRKSEIHFIPHDSHPKSDMPKIGIEYAGTIPVEYCSLYRSWDLGLDSLTILSTRLTVDIFFCLFKTKIAFVFFLLNIKYNFLKFNIK